VNVGFLALAPSFVPAPGAGTSPARSTFATTSPAAARAVLFGVLFGILLGILAGTSAGLLADLGPALPTLDPALRALAPALASTTRRLRVLRVLRPLPDNTIPMPQTVAV
jgi:hypothetical protein